MIRTIVVILLMITALSVTVAQQSNVVTYFDASFEDKELVISWTIENPESISHFNIAKRKSSSGEFTKISEVPFSNFRKKLETDSSSRYTFLCSDKPTENGVYFISLTVYDIRGKELSQPQILKIGINEIPEFKLKQNNPNPFNPSTMISYEIFVPTSVKISVFTLTGQLVDVLVDGFQTQGNYTVTFNATKYSEISSGIYFYKLETEYSSDIRKMIFAK